MRSRNDVSRREFLALGTAVATSAACRRRDEPRGTTPQRQSQEVLIELSAVEAVRGKSIPFTTAMSRNISPGGTAGLPGLVLPVGLTQTGLPASIELDGPSGGDGALFALGLAVERVLGPIPAPNLKA